MAFIALAFASPAAAQRINGSVREADGGPLISGGFVSLLDAAGEAVQADFTAEDGLFSLLAPGPGQYRIQVQRIGYANWITEPYDVAAGQTLAVTVEVPPRPVRLVDLRVEVTAACLDDPNEGEALATVWEEARKALETAVWAEDRGEVTFTLTEYERTLDPRYLSPLESESRVRRHVRLPPFRSLPARRLMTSGYALVDPDSSVFYAPDANVLLSPEFRDTHCFGLRRDEVDDEPMLGVTFRPRDDRGLIDIEGTLWLNEESAELRRVQIRYRNVPLPEGARRQLVGADLTFDRLPDGPFYVRDWWLRFPIGGYSRRIGTAGLSARPRAVLVAYRQTGGTVSDAFVGGVPFEVGEGVVAGVLRDSVSGEPLGGADVVLRNWDDAAAFVRRPNAADAPFSAVTDQAGRFQVGGLPDGAYALGVDHPRLRAAGFRMNETRVLVDDRISEPLELWTPSADALFQRVCPRSSPRGSTGAVVGFARDADTGLPIPDIEVEVVWRVRRLQSTARAAIVSERSEYAGGASDERGRFAICGVPLGEPVVLRPRGVDEGVELELVTRLAWRDAFVER